MQMHNYPKPNHNMYTIIGNYITLITLLHLLHYNLKLLWNYVIDLHIEVCCDSVANLMRNSVSLQYTHYDSFLLLQQLTNLFFK